VDDNSWPLYSETYPNFTIGAYAPDAIYVHSDLQEIVQYAFNRGISIVPEFDGMCSSSTRAIGLQSVTQNAVAVPAHATAWGRGYPALTISCPTGQTLVDPTDTGLLYSTIEGLLDEFVPIFNTDFIHFGGDEVEDFTCACLCIARIDLCFVGYRNFRFLMQAGRNRQLCKRLPLG
jgi:hexosaminidase